jgi:type I restriction-modification system DNA methylase subunit
MVNLLFAHDDLVFQEGKVIKIYDPTCGTGGMLSESEKLIADPETGLNPQRTRQAVRTGIQPRVLRHLRL